MAVGGGVVEETGDLVSIVTDMAVAAERIDEEKSKKPVSVPQPDSQQAF
jgi:F0F1-type ATP synthase epsilon subunit